MTNFPLGKPILREMGGDMRINEFTIPTRTYDAISRYVNQRIATGDFLRAVLTNNLKSAVHHGDAYNLECLVDIVKVIYNYAPSTCWGDEDKVYRWLSGAEE